jgi:glycosyltransferase involved in cell wall biosynthesis
MPRDGSPTVTVVIPSYNSAVWLPETLASVCAQTGVDLETIVVDDGSKDNTREVVATFPDVRYLHQPNAGVAAARNAGIRAARGRYIALLDADDIWETRKLQRQVEVLDRYPDVGLVFSNYRPFGLEVPYRTGFDRSRVLPTIGRRRVGPDAYILESEGLFIHVLRDLFAWNSTLLIRRSAIDEAGLFYERLRLVGEDWLMCLRLSKVCEFAFLDDCLVHRREHPGSNSRIGQHEAQAALVLEHLSGWERLTSAEEVALRERLADTLFGLAYHDLTRGEARSARERLRRYFAVERSLPRAKQTARQARAVGYYAATWLPASLLKRIANLRTQTQSE